MKIDLKNIPFKKIFKKTFYYSVTSLIAVLSLTLMVLLIGLNIPYGRHVLETKIPILTGNMVQIEGISGALPWDIHLKKLTVNDTSGMFVRLEDLQLSWSPLAIFEEKIKINHLSAAHILYDHAPHFAPTQEKPEEKKASQNSFTLNFGVEINDFHIQRVDIAPYALKKDLSQSFALSLESHAQIATIAPFMGEFSLKNIPALGLSLQINNLKEKGSLILDLRHSKPDFWEGHLNYDENEKGFATLLGSLPILDPLSLNLTLKGDFSDLQENLSLKAGHIKAHMVGKNNLLKKQGENALEILAPDIMLDPHLAGQEIKWHDAALCAHFKGDFLHPIGGGFLTIKALKIKDILLGQAALSLKATSENYQILSRFEELNLPGKPLLFAEDPLILKADFSPAQKDQKFKIALLNMLFQLGLEGKLKPALSTHIALTIPELAPLAKIGGIALQGKTDLEADIALKDALHSQDQFSLKEHISLEKGQEQAVRLLGADALLEAHAARDQAGIVKIEDLTLKGQDIGLSLKGLLNPYTQKEGAGKPQSALDLQISLENLADLHKSLLGKMMLQSHLEGFLDNLALTTHSEIFLGVKHPSLKIAPEKIVLDMTASHLPTSPQAHLSLTGSLAQAPLLLDIDFSKKEKSSYVKLNQLSWKSLKGQGVFTLPDGQKIPEGNMALEIDKLQNFQQLIGQQIAGGLKFSFITKSRHEDEKNAPKDLDFTLSSHLKMAHYGVESLTASGKIEDILNHPVSALSLSLKKAYMNEMSGGVEASLKGPENALSVRMKGNFQNILQAPASFQLALLENIPAQQLQIQEFWAKVKKEKIEILHPAHVTYGQEIAISPLEMDISSPLLRQKTHMRIAGKIKPDLAFDASLSHLSLALLQDFIPSFNAEGDISAQAHLLGSFEAPRGNISLSAQDFHMKTEPAASLPNASLEMKSQLMGQKAMISMNAHMAHYAEFALNGGVPLKSDGALDVKAKGNIDISLANAILGAKAMGVGGVVGIDIVAHGSLEKPLLDGGISLSKGSFDHYAQGVHLQAIEAQIEALGDRLHIKKCALQAGGGTMSLSGDIGVFQPSLPLNLEFTMKDAEPVKSDMIDEAINASLHIQGKATTGLDVAGKISLPHVTINIPDSLPGSVPELEIIDVEKENKKKFTPPFLIGLNIDLTSPGEFFVRGHGLFAEMQGTLHIGGNNLAPEVSGGFDLRRGSFNLAGVNLNFSHGHVGFNGSGVGHKLDPTLNFQADRNADGILASLLVSGYASAPKFDFKSLPSKPRDEILSILLFGTERAALSATQLASLGSAVVQLEGGKSFDPLGKVRNSLGLDHLAIGGGSSVENGGTNIEAGKYILKGVYVGAKEGMSGGGSQAQVKIDLTQHLKLKTVVGTGGQVTGFTTPDNDPGSSIGLSYGIDY